MRLLIASDWSARDFSRILKSFSIRPTTRSTCSAVAPSGSRPSKSRWASTVRTPVRFGLVRIFAPSFLNVRNCRLNSDTSASPATLFRPARIHRSITGTPVLSTFLARSTNTLPCCKVFCSKDCTASCIGTNFSSDFLSAANDARVPARSPPGASSAMRLEIWVILAELRAKPTSEERSRRPAWAIMSNASGVSGTPSSPACLPIRAVFVARSFSAGLRTVEAAIVASFVFSAPPAVLIDPA